MRVYIWRGEALLGTSSPAEQSTPPNGLRSAAEEWRGAAPSLPPSLFFFLLLPLPQGRGGGCSADGRPERAAGAPPGCREKQEVRDHRRVWGSLGRLSSSLGGQRGLCGKLEARTPRIAEPGGGGHGGAMLPAAVASRRNRGFGAKRAGTPVTLALRSGVWELPSPRVGAGRSRGDVSTRGARGMGFAEGMVMGIMGFVLGTVTKIRCRLLAGRAD